MSAAPQTPRHRLVDLTWPEARALFAEDPIALLPTGATEPHGPHLPLDVDVLISAAQAEEAARRIVALGVPAFVLPTLDYGVTYFTDGFEGRVSLRPLTLWSMIDDIAASLEEQGVRRIVIVNSHFEPQQVKTLRGVVLDHAVLTHQKAQVVLADPLRRRHAAAIGGEFATGECHAGDHETSIVLAVDASRVRAEVAATLPPRTIGLVAGIERGARSFLQLGADAAYCGAPAEATAAKGHEIVGRLAQVVVETAQQTWPERFAAASAR